MQMSRLMVWSTAFSDDERSETEYRLSADETPLTLSGLPPENRDNSRDNIRTKHFIIAKIHIFTQLSKRNQHRNRSGTCPSRTDKPPGSRSAHTEAGWMAGRGKKVVVYIPEMQEPELMYKLFDKVVGNTYDLIRFFEPNKVPKKMTKEEMDILWEESGRKQDKMMAEVKAAHGEPFEPSPMIQRMLDGSDIVARDEE